LVWHSEAQHTTAAAAVVAAAPADTEAEQVVADSLVNECLQTGKKEITL